MKGKTLAVLATVAILSSLSTIGVYKFFEEPQQVIVRETPTPVYTNYTENVDELISDKLHRSFRSSAPTNFIEAAEMVTPAVVNISSRAAGRFDFWGGGYGGSSGSGVIISPDGYIVTNNHVIEDGRNLIEVTLNDKREYKAKLVGIDPTTDIAVIKIEPQEPLPFLLFGNSDSVRIGEWVLAVGNPFNLASTVTAGIVSAKGRSIDILEGEYKIESFIQTDAAVNPGNSGGALVNTNGELVGINTAIITRSGRYEGYSFAIPANLARKVVRDLREYGKVRRAILGVRIGAITNENAAKLGLDKPEGVVIQGITPNSAAEEAGLKPDDVIVGLNGRKIASVPELQETVARFRPGKTISVDYIRKGKSYKTRVTLKNLSQFQEIMPSYAESGPIEESKNLMDELGFELRDLTSGEMNRLRIDGGVMVENIIEGGTIEKTNMDPGFIITEINELEERGGDDIRKINVYEISSIDDVLEALSKVKTGVVLLEGVYESYPGEWGYTFEF